MRVWSLLMLAAAVGTVPAQNVPGLQPRPYPGHPFTGEETIFWTHQVNGRTVVGQLVARNVRDGKGRLYLENHEFAIGPTNPQANLIRTTVYDPVAGTRTECEMSKRLCRIWSFQGPGPAILVRPTLVAAPNSTGLIDNGRHQLTVEDLGTHNIDDIPARGSRHTTSMAPGASGDDKSGTSVIETWYSSDLMLTLAQTRNYPNGEIQDLKLKILSRAEPDLKTFAPPDGFSIQDNRLPTDPAGKVSLGNGVGTGLGNVTSSGGTYSGPLKRIGGNVSPPEVIFSVEPGFTQEARAAKVSGIVLVNLVVDPQGLPQNVHVLRGVDKGLDQKAVEAVMKYRFKPAVEDGKPIAVPLNIQVNFQIF